jgi:general secretion pathway protein B
MSYILEALKKSDKNRKREEIPDLSSDHSFTSPRREERKVSVWKRPIILILLFLAILASVWVPFLNRSQKERTEKTDPVVAPTPLSVPEKVIAIPPERKRQINKEVTKAIARIESLPEPEKLQKPVEVAVLPLMEELPVEIKTAMPDLTFAGHVYAAKREQRMIMINKRVVREGDMVSPGLILEEIEPNGVVLRYQDVSFRVHLF